MGYASRSFSLAIAAAAAVLGGCQLTDSGTNVVNGKEQFVAKCGSCHVLARAGTTGVVGPNLDEAFQRARKDGFGESTFEGIVHQPDPVPGDPAAVRPGDRQGAAADARASW